MARKKAFRVDAAVDRAMELFWLQGYGRTSLPDLLEHMRIGRQSLYDTFGSKRQLYLRALDRYAELPVGRALAGLEVPGAGPRDIEAFFRRLIATQTRREAPGCLMVGAAQELAPIDQAVAERVARHRLRLEAAFQNALAGRMPEEHASRAASHLLTLTEGLLLAARSRAGRRALEAIEALALQVVSSA